MSAASKIAKVGSPDETELSVAQALYDLETSVPDLKKELRPLQFNSAREVCIFCYFGDIYELMVDWGWQWKEGYCDFRAYPSSWAIQQNPTTVLTQTTYQWSRKRQDFFFFATLILPFSYSLTWNFRLTRELEKKFSDRHVVFIGQRRIMSKPGRNNRQKQPRPMSRTLTHVHDKILEDLVFPTEIVGKRTRVLTDGKKIIKVSVLTLDNNNV
jgi:small subunit ribosomal protein S7e